MSVPDQVVERVIGLILDEGLKPGERLPSERELQSRLGISRSSLREALKTLTAIGAVSVAVGGGTFVGSGGSSLLAKPLAWGFLMSEAGAREVIGARRAVEPATAALCAVSATADERQAIARGVEAMRAALSDAERYVQLDLGFHLAIAAGGHNRLLQHVLDMLRHLVRAWVVQNYSDMTPAERVEAFEEHPPIQRAIEARDPEAAQRAMAAHLDAAGARLVQVVARREAERAHQNAEGSACTVISAALPSRPASNLSSA